MVVIPLREIYSGTLNLTRKATISKPSLQYKKKNLELEMFDYKMVISVLQHVYQDSHEVFRANPHPTESAVTVGVTS